MAASSTTGLTAEQHNAARRETKRRQQANKKAAAASKKAEVIARNKPTPEDIAEQRHFQAVKFGLEVNEAIYKILDRIEANHRITFFLADCTPQMCKAIQELKVWNQRQALPLQIETFDDGDIIEFKLPATILHDLAVEHGKAVNAQIYQFLDQLDRDGVLTIDTFSANAVEYQATKELVEWNVNNNNKYHLLSDDDVEVTFSVRDEQVAA